MGLRVDIEKTLGSFILKSKFETEDGVTALLGASGCGKSMTLKCIAGIETPDQGRIVLDGRVLFDSAKKINVPTRKRKLGYLFQNYALFPNMTVEENILCGTVGTKEERKAAADAYMEQFCIHECRHQYPDQLSGGQQQRVALARMLASKPELILLDEPFSALDEYLKWTLEQEIMDILDSFPGTVLFVSHNREEVYRIADRIAVMSGGKIETLTPKKELFEDPNTLAGTLLTGCENISRAAYVDASHVLALDWGITLKAEREVMKEIQYVGFRAHHFEEVRQAETENVFVCEISRVMEGTSSLSLMFYNQGSDTTKADARLRCDVPVEERKASLDSRLRKGLKTPLYLKMPGDKLILMT